MENQSSEDTRSRNLTIGSQLVPMSFARLQNNAFKESTATKRAFDNTEMPAFRWTNNNHALHKTVGRKPQWEIWNQRGAKVSTI